MTAPFDGKRFRVFVLGAGFDWFDRTDYTWLEERRRKDGFDGHPPDTVFAHESEFGVTRLLDGPRQPDDPLGQMYRVRHIQSLYAMPILFSATPWLLAPSSAKILYAGTLRDFWHGMGNAGVLNFGLSIIGYSLPAQDEYARQVLHAMVTNYQEAHWEEDVAGLRKQPLVIIDRCPDAKARAAFKARYRFVNWNRAILYSDGLTQDSVKLALGQA